ncbi:MAG: AAA family ATPase [Gammaproteobacteria bacterium]|jgi:hypothetical protein
MTVENTKHTEYIKYINSILYWHQDHYKKGYVDYDTGALVIDRLLSGKSKFYELINRNKSKNRKTLIVSDWLLRSKGDLTYDQRKKWDNLIADGHKVFVWTGKLEQVYSSDELIKKSKNIKLDSNEEIKQFAIKQGFSLSEISCIDYFNMKEIFKNNQNSNKKNNLLLDDLRYIKNNQDDLLKILSLLKQQEEINIEIIYNDKNLLNAYVQKLFQSGKVKSIKLSVYDPDFYGELLENIDKNSIKLDVAVKRGTKLQEDCISILQFNDCKNNLQKIEIEDGEPITTENIKTIFENYPNLEEFYFKSSIRDDKGSIFKNIALNSPLQLKKLKIISFKNAGGLAAKDLEIIFRFCSNLEKLDLSWCGNIINVLRELSNNSSLQLINLKKLNLSDIEELTDEAVEAIFKLCPNLEELNLSACFYIENAFKNLSQDLRNRLKKLKILNLYQTNITTENLEVILKCCPNLEVLNIGECEEIVGEFEDLSENSRFRLTHLKELSLIDATMSKANIETILKISPNLEDLNAIGSKKLLSVFRNLKNTQFQLKKLKILNLEDVILDADDIENIFRICPNLEELEFDVGDSDEDDNYGEKAKIFEYIAQETQLKLGKLKELDLREKKFIPLKSILKIFPNLNKLILSDCKGIDNELKGLLVENPHFLYKTLKTLDLGSTDVTANCLKIIAKICPNLEELILSSCQNITKAFQNLLTDSQFTLKSLKNLNLSKTNITAKDLEAIFTICPNLEELYLLQCNNIAKAFANLLDKSQRPLTNIKTLKLSESVLTKEDFVAILKLFPNLETLEISLPQDLEIDALNFAKDSKNLSLKKLSLSRVGINTRAGMLVVDKLLDYYPCLCELRLDHLKEENKKFIKSDDLVRFMFNDIPENILKKLKRVKKLLHCSFSNTQKNTNEHSFDTHTENTTECSYYTRHFWGNKKIPVEGYRKECLNHINLNKFPDQIAFIHKSMFDPNLFMLFLDAEEFEKKYKQCQEQELDYYYGGFDVYLDSKNYVPLPSLTILDQIDYINCKSPLDVVYSITDNLYYVKLAENTPSQHVHIEYLLRPNALKMWEPSPKINARRINSYKIETKGLHYLINLRKQKGLLSEESSLNKVLELFAIDKLQKHELSKDEKDKFVQKLQKYFGEFKSGALDNVSESTGLEKLLQCILQKKGACRHRAYAFKFLAAYVGIPARIINNDVHTFVEINLSENLDVHQWQIVELGGYPAELTQCNDDKLDIEKIIEQKEKKQELLEELNDLDMDDPKSLESLGENNRFITWRDNEDQYSNLDDFWHKLLNEREKIGRYKNNLLVKVESDERVKNVRLVYKSLSEYINKNNSKYYYIDNAEDLYTLLKSYRIEQGRKKAVPGPLKLFFDNFGKTGGCLIINWEHFSLDEMVTYHSILDNHLEGYEIPKDLLIIGLINERNEALKDSSFTPRHNRSNCRRLSQDLLSNLSESFVKPKIEKEIKPDIDLFKSDEFNKLLLGHYHLENGRLRFIKGKLLEAIIDGKKEFVIQNAPHELWGFQLLMHEIKQNRRIFIDGRYYSVCPDFKIKYTQKPYKIPVNNYDSITKIYPLNYFNYKTFFVNYVVNPDDYTVTEKPGLLELCEGKTLNLLLTDDLDDYFLARLLNCAKKHKCKINFYKAQKEHLLKEIKLNKSALRDKLNKPAAWIITSKDIHTTAKLIKREIKNARIIPITEYTSYGDLIQTRKNLTKSDDSVIKIQLIVSDLWKLLQQGETIILKGRIPDVLLKQLETLFVDQYPHMHINGEFEKLKGRLIVVTDTTHMLILSTHYTMDENDKSDKMDIDNNKYIKENVKSKHKNNKMDIDDQYKYIEHIDEAENRLSIVQQHLKKSPCLIIEGETGVGKSHFVTHNFTNLFQGTDNLEKWARTKSNNGEPVVLFIDEYNIGKDEVLGKFAGLYCDKPHILLNGRIYELTANHKVIFAGNPSNYTGRYVYDFTRAFPRKVNKLIFKKYSDLYLAEKIIVPLFLKLHDILLCDESKNDSDDNQMTDENSIATLRLSPKKIVKICKIFLSIYHKVEKVITITPRNLQMMVLRFMIKFSGKENVSLEELKLLTVSAGFDEIKDSLNKEQLTNFENILRTKKVLLSDLNKIQSQEDIKKYKQLADNLLSDNFVCTDTHNKIYHQLNTLLKIRKLRHEHAELEQYGIRGLLIEGPPGIGKSQFILSALKAQGYSSESVDTRKKYYHITAGGNYKIMKETLIKAFHEGAIVVVDEFNMLPLEKILNHLLHGLDPDGNKAKKSGLCVVGSQNFIDILGRRVLSPALQNRMLNVKLNDYSLEELQKIANGLVKSSKKYVDNSDVQKLVQEFIVARNHAIEHHLSPPPNFRDFLLEMQRIISLTQQTRKKDNDIVMDKEKIKKVKKTVKRKSIRNYKRFSERRFFDNRHKKQETKLKQSQAKQYNDQQSFFIKPKFSKNSTSNISMPNIPIPDVRSLKLPPFLEDDVREYHNNFKSSNRHQRRYLREINKKIIREIDNDTLMIDKERTSQKRKLIGNTDGRFLYDDDSLPLDGPLCKKRKLYHNFNFSNSIL